MDDRINHVLRFASSLALLFLLFAVKWRPELQHFDFQVWEAALNMIPDGTNPYDAAALNQELQSHPDQYGDSYDNDNFYMFLSNPPTWLATVWALGTSTLVVSLLGAAMLFGSIVALTRDRSLVITMVALISTTAFALQRPTASIFLLGQWGLFAAGMVGLQLLLRNKMWSGVPTALLAAKPHIAFAAGIVDLVRNPRRAALRLLAPYALLVVGSLVLLGPGTWQWFIEGLVAGNTHPTSNLPDMSLGTLAPWLPWRSLGLAGVLIGMGLSTALAWKCRNRDPQVVLFASLAVTIFFSGHAFAHDWLWLPLVPVALRWGATATTISILGIAQLVGMSYDYADTFRSLQPSIGLLVTVGLVGLAFSAEPQTPGLTALSNDQTSDFDRPSLPAAASGDPSPSDADSF